MHVHLININEAYIKRHFVQENLLYFIKHMLTNKCKDVDKTTKKYNTMTQVACIV